MTKSRGSTLTFLMTAAVVSTVLAVGQREGAFAQAKPADPVARLAERIERGETTLEFRPGTGYLRSLLDHLDVRVDSQVLVFSKTSFQQALISPRAPRAVFFNDTTAVGAVQGGEVFELVSADPDEGLVFYTMTAAKEAPRFERRGVQCVFCHLPGNHGAPGLVVTSVIPNTEGVPFFGGSFFSSTDHRTPFEQRWGGWYVTGSHGSQAHMGNSVAPDPDLPIELDLSASQNLTTLEGRFDLTNYLSPFSDIVALLTLEHQAGVTNRIFGLRAQYERAQRIVMTDKVTRGLDAAVDQLVAYMIFADEAPLREPVAGVSGFSRTFPDRGPRDAQGRSLRDFDLRTRLFRYPLSYMIYSEVFDRLPPGLRDRVFRRLFDVLTGADTREIFAGPSPEALRDALEIVLATRKNLPDYWSMPAGEPTTP